MYACILLSEDVVNILSSFYLFIFPGETKHIESKLSEMEIIIKKTTAGLGLSIAGGVGSTPYKGDDEVCKK